MTGVTADLMVEAREGTGGTTGGTGAIEVVGTEVVGTAIDFMGGTITVIGALTGADSGKLLFQPITGLVNDDALGSRGFRRL
jgi:hypothetical protein